jgi:hypothetical protein
MIIIHIYKLIVIKQCPDWLQGAITVTGTVPLLDGRIQYAECVTKK